VTPQINLGRSVRLQLDLKNDTLQNPQNPGVTPLINTSKIKNSVIVNSDDILVLGGLISHSNNENINKVPILSSIPIIGFLFQQKTGNQQKKNLMVFIKPLILHTGEDAMTITHMKYGQMKSIQANYTEDLENIGNERMDNALPPWKNTKDLPKPFAEKRDSD
jgi:general secretion pathway protein D